MKKVLIGFVVLIAIVLVGGLFLPKDMHIEREIVIEKPNAVVFSYLKSLRNGTEWNPWAKRDPNIKIDYRGTDGEVGAVSSWEGNKEVGVGEQEITNIVDGQKIDFALRFKEPFASTSSGYLVTETLGENQTKVKWGMTGENKYPFNIICFVMNMTEMMNKDFDEGLNSLKSILEKQL